MCPNGVKSFVRMFFPERICFWNELSETEAVQMCSSRLLINLEDIVFNPEQNRDRMKEAKEGFSDIVLFMNHRECTFDLLHYRKLSNQDRWISVSHRYDRFFEDEKNCLPVSERIKRPETIFANMLKLIPDIYADASDSLHEDRRVLGSFYKQNGDYYFSSCYENIHFETRQLCMIPAFIQYRNRNLLTFIEQERNLVRRRADMDALYDAKATGIRNEEGNSFLYRNSTFVAEVNAHLEEIRQKYVLGAKIFCCRNGFEFVSTNFNGGDMIIEYCQNVDGFRIRCTKTVALDRFQEELA